MRLTKEQLQDVKKKFNVDRLWSWSMVDTFIVSPYCYYLKYIKHAKEDVDNCAYATLGSICHSIIEDLHSNKIKPEEMNDIFNDGWLTAICIADLKFDRNDEAKNSSISKKYKENPEKMDTVMANVEQLYNDAMNGKTKLGDSHEIDAAATAELRARMEAQRKGGDGYKFILTDGSSVLLRKSGTDPLVKCYIEATGENAEAAKKNSDVLAKQMETFLNA